MCRTGQGEEDSSSEHARSLAAFEEMLEFLVIRLVRPTSLSLMLSSWTVICCTLVPCLYRSTTAVKHLHGDGPLILCCDTQQYFRTAAGVLYVTLEYVRTQQAVN